MENNLEYIDHLIRTKAYEELNEEELKLIQQHMGSKESFEHFKGLVGAVSSSAYHPSKQVKAKLMTNFKRRHQSWFDLAISYQTPAYLNLSLILLAALIFWIFIPPKEVMVKDPIVVELPGKTDTLIVEKPADTVFIERVVRVKVPVLMASEKPEQPKPVNGSRTMADQQELWELVGSDD
ncbi:hypothetical protein [Marinoscillum sp.]|uniref:hypothetical protein n=1 Tax=Marinoscillum sp. TaxID=2024838 RepID=UPI003BAA598C